MPFKAYFLSTVGYPENSMYLYCILETLPFLLHKALLRNVCPHNEVIISVLLVVVVVMLCKIKVFLVRCIGCSIEERSLKPTF